jgi:hypothetical protein
MSFLSRLFGTRSRTPSRRDVEAELSKLEAEAKDARPGYVGSAYNRAGDVALRHKQADRAMEYYGRAIDAFLEDSQREAARGVANKIVRVRPSAVRTMCTLTWLDLAARHDAMALLHVRDYADAARGAGQEAVAATQIFEMARISANADFLEGAADALEGLGFGNRAGEVRKWVPDGAPHAILDEDKLVAACVEAAVKSGSESLELITDDAVPADPGDEGESPRPAVEDELPSEPTAEDAEARTGP